MAFYCCRFFSPMTWSLVRWWDEQQWLMNATTIAQPTEGSWYVRMDALQYKIELTERLEGEWR
jgi:hypothetical protein